MVGPAIWYLYAAAHFTRKYAVLKEGDKPNVDNLWILNDNSLTSVKKVRKNILNYNCVNCSDDGKERAFVIN